MEHCLSQPLPGARRCQVPVFSSRLFTYPSAKPDPVSYSALHSPPISCPTTEAALQHYPNDYTRRLVGSVPFHDRHVFLCFKGPSNWPSSTDSYDWGCLPRMLRSKIKELSKAAFTICEGNDEVPSSFNGDILIFPDMLLYRAVTRFDVECFVEEALVKEKKCLLQPVTITGCHVFVCCHNDRGTLCGAIGPAVAARFEQEVMERGLSESIFIRKCCHLGSECSGGVVIFKSFQPKCSSCGGSERSTSTADLKHSLRGDWYGRVTPDDVLDLFEIHIMGNEIVERLWRGRSGLNSKQQADEQFDRLQAMRYEEQNLCSCQEQHGTMHIVNATQNKADQLDYEKAPFSSIDSSVNSLSEELFPSSKISMLSEIHPGKSSLHQGSNCRFTEGSSSNGIEAVKHNRDHKTLTLRHIRKSIYDFTGRMERDDWIAVGSVAIAAIYVSAAAIIWRSST